MNTKSKILFTDLDGTLLDDRKKVTEDNVEAIYEALCQGHSVVLCTGRPLAGAKTLIRDLNLEQQGCYAITYNGGLIYDCYKKEAIFKKSLPLSYVHYIFEQTQKFGLHCHTYSNSHVLSPVRDSELEDYLHNTVVPCQIVPHLLDTLTDEPIKVLAIELSNPDKLVAYRKAMQDWSKGKVSIFLSSDHYLEHVMEGVSKGSAILALCEKLGIPLENTIAAGDAENDIPMLQVAGVGIAMANATPAVKAEASYITQNDNNHSGISEIIRKFML